MENQSFLNSGVGMGLMGVGGGIISGIGDYLGGGQQRQWNKEEMERKRQLRSLLMGQMNKPAISPGSINSFAGRTLKMIAPQQKKLAESLAGMGGNNLSSGDISGEMARLGYGDLMKLVGGYQKDADLINANRPLDIMRLLAMV
jgi:hypothetical protein